jgi:hypothetical protein
LTDLQAREVDARNDAYEAKEKLAALIEKARADAT